MNTVLVTGGLGNIGLKIVDELYSRGYKVRCLDLKNKANQKRAKRYRGKIDMAWCDITDRNNVLDAVKGVDAVIHTAAILPPFSEDQPALATKVNVEGTRNIISALEKENPKAHLIFSSSVSVHGIHFPDHQPGRTVTDPYRPADVYSENKIACEMMLEECHLDWTILRISACVDEKARMLSLANLKGSIETFFKVNSKCRIEYVHPADVATAMVNAVGNDDAIGQRFFLGGGERCRSNWRDLNSIRLEMLGLSAPPPECFGEEGFYTEWLDTDDAQRVLNYQNHDLDDYRKELKEMLKWPRRVLGIVPAALKNKVWKLVPYLVSN